MATAFDRESSLNSSPSNRSAKQKIGLKAYCPNIYTVVTGLATMPFGIIIADAAFPEQEQYVIGLRGEIRKIDKNSWIKHFSISNNERYNFLIRMTWSAFSFFSTVALSIQLIKGKLFAFI